MICQHLQCADQRIAGGRAIQAQQVTGSLAAERAAELFSISST
jgi:hypothetical protein